MSILFLTSLPDANLFYAEIRQGLCVSDLLVKVLVFVMHFENCSDLSSPVVARIIKPYENLVDKQSNKAVLCFVADMIIQTEGQAKKTTLLWMQWRNKWRSILPPFNHHVTAIRSKFAFSAWDESVKNSFTELPAGYFHSKALLLRAGTSIGSWGLQAYHLILHDHPSCLTLKVSWCNTC